MDKQPGPDPLHPEERECELQQRYLARERRKVIGLLAIALVILIATLLLFGRSIPWNAQ